MSIIQVDVLITATGFFSSFNDILYNVNMSHDYFANDFGKGRM